MSFELSDSGSLVDVDGAPNGVLNSGESVNFSVSFSCSDLSEGTKTSSLTVTGTNIPTDSEIGSQEVFFGVNVIVPPPPVPDPGVLAIAGPTLLTKVHTIGGSACPDNFMPISVTHTGDSPLDWNVTGKPSFLSNPSPSSGTLNPDQIQNISSAFTCSNYNMGLNTGHIVIEGNGQTIQVEIQLTVQNP